MRNNLWIGSGISGMGGIPMLGTGARGLTTLIREIFRNGVQGFAYDPNDLTTLYQDAAGTIPVTAAGQPVGLMLDKSKGLVLSDELSSRIVDFTDWVKTAAVISASENSFTTAGFGGCYNTFGKTLSSGKTYQIRIIGYCTVTFFIRSPSSGVGAIFIPAGAFDLTLKTSVSFPDGLIYFQLQTAGTITVNSISIKELAGNHAYQTVSASRPILQRNATTGAYYLAFDGVDDFLRTASVSLSTTDKVTVIASVASLGGVYQGMLHFNNTNTSPSSFYLAINASANPSFISGGSTPVVINHPTPLTPAVYTAKADISGDLLSLAVNRNEIISNVDLGTGNFGTYPLTIGARQDIIHKLTGNIYGICIVGSSVKQSDISLIEREYAKRMGVTLNV